MRRFFLFWSFIGLAAQVNASPMRSAGLYFTPEQQIEINTTAAYKNYEFRRDALQGKGSTINSGARFEHGINAFLSWGTVFNYGTSNSTIKKGNSSVQLSREGLYDPEFFLKAHYTTESFRFHANSLLRGKADTGLVNTDLIPLNNASGGSSFALQLAAEMALGPTLVGTEITGDLWRDSQELRLRDSSKTEATYFRDGGKETSISIFGEINNLKTIKPGIRLSGKQTVGTSTTIQENQINATSSMRASYQLPMEQHLGLSLYGRVRLPAHFVLNFEVFGQESYRKADTNDKSGQTYGVYTNLGYKF